MKRVSYEWSDKHKALVAKTRYTFTLLTPVQIVYCIILHYLWHVEHKTGYYSSVSQKLRGKVHNFAKKHPNCYYKEEPRTDWDDQP